jgi:Tfp pilus assembly protein PilE
MDPFEKKGFFPVELMIALAINFVVAAIGYYAIMMWGLFSG